MQAVAAPLASCLAKFITSCHSAPPTTALAVFANLCKYKSFHCSLKRVPHLNRLLRRLIEMLDLDDIPAVVHSLRILMQLVGTNSAVQALFSETNVLEAQKVMIAVLGNPDAEPNAREAAGDLLRIMLTEDVFRKSFTAEVAAFEEPMKALVTRPELEGQLFRLGAILLKYGGSAAPKFVRPLIKLQVAQKAMDRLLAPVPRHDAASIAYAESVRDACDVIQALLDALLDDAVDQHYFDVIAEVLIPTIPDFLNFIVDFLSAEDHELVNEPKRVSNVTAANSRQPILELALALLRYKSFELDDRDLEGTNVQKMRTLVAMQWISETGVGDQIGVLIAAVYGAVADILSAGRQQVAPLPSRADDGPRLARIMARSTSPYVIHACIALLTQTPPDTWTSFGVSMCKTSEETHHYKDDVDDPPDMAEDVAAPLADDMAAPPAPALVPELLDTDCAEVPVEQPPEVCQSTSSESDLPSTIIPATPPLTEANRTTEAAPSPSSTPSQIVPVGSARAGILAEMRRAADLVDEQMATFEQTIDSLQRTIKENEQHLTQSACTLLTAENQVSEQKEIIAELQDSLKQTTRELATTRDELAGTTNQIAQLEAEVAAASRANRTKESTSRKEIAKLSAQVSELQELQATLAQTTTTQKGTIAALREQLRAANIEQEERERAHDELLAHLSSALNATKKTRRGTTKGIVAIGGEPQILEDQED
ncbi:hypothetical protein HDU89_001087 [Geranomyces variabilis]|nr:hypothetical protein HDU89_001087 [Geranomyces variabilis]